MKSRDLSQKEVQKLLDYNPKTGEFTWKTGKFSGRKAGYYSKVGMVIFIKNLPRQGRRLAWIYLNGKIPKGHVIVQKDNNPHNLRLKNLELVSNSLRALLKRDTTNVAYKPKLKSYHCFVTVNGKKLGVKYIENKVKALAYAKKLKAQVIKALRDGNNLNNLKWN